MNSTNTETKLYIFLYRPSKKLIQMVSKCDKMIASHLIKNLIIPHKSQLGDLPPCGPKMKKYPFFIKSQKCLKKPKFSTFSFSPGSRLIPNLIHFSFNSDQTLIPKITVQINMFQHILMTRMYTFHNYNCNFSYY